MDEVVWEALLKRDIVITPLVRQELQPWLDNPRCNTRMRDEVKQAIDRSHPRIHIKEIDKNLSCHGLLYYMNLLILRKLYGFGVARDFTAKYGHHPNKNEFYKIVAPTVRERGAILAWKGSQDFSKTNFWADEELTVMAALSALLSGNEVTVLTRDHDVQEQFYKLLFLIEIQYWSMLLANRYASDPSAFSTIPIPKNNSDPQQRFSGDNDLIFAPILDSKNGWRGLLPEPRRDVLVQCLWFAGGPSQMTFCPLSFNADLDMVKLLDIKSRTCGLNTDKLEGRNCHALPYPDHAGLRPFAAVAMDRKVDILGRFECSAVDFVHALHCVERYEMLEWSES